MEEMTEKQLAVLRFIHQFSREQGHPPTVREIGTELKIASTKGTYDYLKALELKGFLSRTGKTSRALWITPEGRKALGLDDTEGRTPDDTVLVPVVGHVAAGALSLATENIEDTLRIDSKMVGGAGKDIFALRLRGDSMIGDNIANGDLVLVRKASTAETGAIVIALIDDDATCKRYFPEGDQVRLQPSNPRMGPIYVKKSEFRQTMIQGVVVGVYRRVGKV